jgi:hypothetical protein
MSDLETKEPSLKEDLEQPKAKCTMRRKLRGSGSGRENIVMNKAWSSDTIKF